VRLCMPPDNACHLVAGPPHHHYHTCRGSYSHACFVVVPMKSLHGYETRAGLTLGNVYFRHAISPSHVCVHVFSGSVAFFIKPHRGRCTHSG